MRDAATKSIEITTHRQRDDLDSDEVLTLALTHLVEILGEAAKNVSQSTKEAYPNLPWRRMDILK